MSELLLPTWIVPEGEQQELIDDGSSIFRSAFAPGFAQRQSYGGLRLKLSRRHTVRLEEKAILLAALRATRGGYNAIRTKVHFALRGSFPATQLVTNNTFANGTTGWSALSPVTSIASADRAIRVERIGNDTLVGTGLYNTSGITLTQYVPYVARAMSYRGQGFSGTYLTAGTTATSLVNGGQGGSATSYGLLTAGFIAQSASPYYIAAGGWTVAGASAGDFLTVPYFSLTRCCLSDHGSNLLVRSDEFDNASWLKTRATVTSNFATAPDGSASGDSLIETATAGTHYAYQVVSCDSAAADFTITCALRANTRTWAYLELDENTGSSAAQLFFNLSTGALGSSSVGANWSGVRGSIASLGNSWYLCSITARKTNAATSLNALVGLASANGTSSYSGDGTSGIFVWRATLAKSSVATHLVQTTSSATTGSSPTGGDMYVKGLPASTNGLLLPDDIFEINGELKMCTAALNSDAAGLGYLQFEPPLVRSTSDNDPVIIADPMGKFLVSNVKIDNEFGTQARVSYDLEHIYE